MNVPTEISFTPWNKGKLVGQKAPLRLRDIWAIRVRLQLAKKTRNLALFNLVIDSKLRGCDLVNLRVRDIAHGACISPRAIAMQQKTHRPVQFEITEQLTSLFSTGYSLLSSARTSFFPAESIAHSIYQRANMPVL
ncbi:hypothetical protein [Vreelandella titanicae]|jgi:hypothetical protein|uniref:hypothetical protein n=1 Tax=Vreelandella titanicae TaxID=664683 RepID=UPI003CD0BB1E